MTDLTASPDLLRPPPGLGVAAPGASNQKLKETADAFEASFLSQMLKPMFEGLSTDGLFGGGQAEGTWRSFLLDEMAKKTVASGGVGLSNMVMTKMLKMQEKGE